MTNKFYEGGVYCLRGTATSDAGFDLTARGNRFLGINTSAVRTVSIVRFTGLGSALWTDNIVTVSGTSGPSFWLESVASLYGGFQAINSVFEQNGSQPAFYAQGSSALPIPYLHFSNNIITGSNGPAVLLSNTNKAHFIGGAISSNGATGSFNFQGFGASNNVSLTDVTFEGNTSVAPIQAPANSGGSITMAAVKWGGVAPVFDGTAMGAGALKYFEWFGGSPGTAQNPFKLPANTLATIMSQGAAISGKLAAVPTAGPGAGLYAEYVVPSNLVGGTAGACSKIGMAGTSAAYTVIAANVGSGC